MTDQAKRPKAWQMSVSLPAEYHDRLREIAGQQQQSVAAVVRQAIEDRIIYPERREGGA